MLYDFFLKNLFIFIALIMIISLLLFEIFFSRKFKNAIQVIDVLKLINHDNAIIFDFRSEVDYKKSHIIDSVNVQINKVNVMYFFTKKYKNKKIILICNNNNDALKAIKNLQAFKQFLYCEFFYLDGGFNSWIKENMPTTSL
ncbi:MAG TPA: rhodanese-like domain-containing protein [Candidatus Azoamicus sp.]